MKQIEKICLKTFWMYFVVQLATTGIYVAVTDVSPKQSFKSEGQVILSSDLEHLCVEINLKQIEDGLHVAAKTLKHLEEVTASVKSQVPEIELLLHIAKFETEKIQSFNDDMIMFFPAKVQEPRIEKASLPTSGTRIVKEWNIKKCK